MLLHRTALLRLSQFQTGSKTSNFGSQRTLHDILQMVRGLKPSHERHASGLFPGGCAMYNEPCGGTFPIMALFGCRDNGVVHYNKVQALHLHNGQWVVNTSFRFVKRHTPTTPAFLQSLPETLDVDATTWEYLSQYPDFVTLMDLLTR